MSEIKNLRLLFGDKSKTQLMRQELGLLGLRYVRVDDLFFIHSYFEEKETHSENPQFQAPTMLSEIKRSQGGVELTIRALKDQYDSQAIECLRSLGITELESSYSHIVPRLLTPRIKDGEWDNWSFAFSVAPEARLAKRKARTRLLCERLYTCFTGSDFSSKKILFLGCGDGDEIEVFLNTFPTQRAQIIGLDQSNVAIANCLRLEAIFKSVKFKFQQGNLNNLSSLEGENFDLVIAIGVFDRETLTFAVGQEILRYLRKILSFDRLLCKAYSFELFSSEHYRELGFNVLATCNPKSVYTRTDNFFYLLSKSEQHLDSDIQLSDQVAKSSLKFWQ